MRWNINSLTMQLVYNYFNLSWWVEKYPTMHIILRDIKESYKSLKRLTTVD